MSSPQFDEIVFNEKKAKVYSFINDYDGYVPMKKNDIRDFMNVAMEERELFSKVVEELLKEGKIIETKKGKIQSTKKLNMETGTFVGNMRGFGFVVVDGEDSQDIFIPPDRTMGAMHKDRVLCKIVKPAKKDSRCEGEIIKIIERGKKEIVGRFEKSKGYGFVIPDEKKYAYDIFVSKDNSKGAETGHKVVVEITKWSENGRNPEGRIKEILGHVNDPGVDILSVIKDYDIPVEFPPEVMDQIENIPDEVPEEDMKGREDLRDVLMVTIDGEDAKDLDDAVSLEVFDNFYRLGVHIADVTNYVKENSYLDKEALKRGTSVYIVDRVIPMLPHKLSNGICSLNPNVNRLALSCIMDINKSGEVKSYRIVESVIKTHRRLSYTVVENVIKGIKDETTEEIKDVIPMLLKMDELRKILHQKRDKRGSINFDFPEAKILVDENGKPYDIVPREQNEATNLIEEFMLAANECVAEDAFWQNIPFVYRIHEAPDSEKLIKLSEFLSNFGLRIKGAKTEVHPNALAEILNGVKGKPEEHIISKVVLRSMRQARYMAENLGHFGLAARYYCHFTSPIRRYPDLTIHRIIKENIKTGLSDKRIKYLNTRLPDTANRSSFRERVAEDAERKVEDMKKVEFMKDKIGNVYDGIISGVTNWGIYVELPNTVEGMISVSSMDDDYYIFDESKMMFVGERFKKTYRLGDKVKVMVVRASKELMTIDFAFVDDDEE